MSSVVVQYVDVDFNDLFEPDTVVAYFEDFDTPPYAGQEVIARDRAAGVEMRTSVAAVDEESRTAQLHMSAERQSTARVPDAGRWGMRLSSAQRLVGNTGRLRSGFYWSGDIKADRTVSS